MKYNIYYSDYEGCSVYVTTVDTEQEAEDECDYLNEQSGHTDWHWWEIQH